MVNNNEFKQSSILSTDDIKTGEPLFTREKIGKSALEKIGTKEHGNFVVLGKHRITEPFPSMEELNKYLIEEPEDFIIRLCSTLIGITLNAKTEITDPNQSELL